MQNGTHKKAHGVVYSAVIVIKKTYYTNFLQNAVNRSKLYANCIRDVHDWRVLRAIYIYTIYTIMPSTIYIHNATSSSSIFVLSHGIYILQELRLRGPDDCNTSLLCTAAQMPAAIYQLNWIAHKNIQKSRLSLLTSGKISQKAFTRDHIKKFSATSHWSVYWSLYIVGLIQMNYIVWGIYWIELVV